MQALVARLTQTRLSRPNLPTAIFGSADTLSSALDISRPPVRIGVWPVVSAQTPETAMGLAALLAFLLERYAGVRVYRLFAQLESEPDSYKWDMARSQFSVDDWQLDGLDENVAVWGSLAQSDSGWQLELNVENDLAAEGDDLKVFSRSAPDIASLTAALRGLAADIAAYLDAGDTPITAPVFDAAPASWDAEPLETLLGHAFECELALLLALWGQPRAPQEAADDVQALIDAAVPLGSLGAWAAASAFARFVSLTPDLDETIIMDTADALIAAFPTEMIASVIAAGSLYSSGYPQAGFDILDEAVAQHPTSTLPRVVLAEFYRQGSRLFEALDVLQQAIEEDVVDAGLYVRYASLLSVLDYNGMIVEDFVLIDMTQRAPNLLALEALAAYTAALELEPDNLSALSGQLAQYLEVGSVRERFWDGFARLVAADSTGEVVRNLLDSMEVVDDFAPGIEILRRAAAGQPESVHVWVNLAAACVLAGDGDEALRALAQARALTDDAAVLTDIERLTLSAADPDFEMRLGEIIDIISAGGRVNVEDAEYLEAAVASAPTLADVYVLLAKTYAGWGEIGSALETLLDGYKHAPDDAELVFLLGQTLWDSGERDLALSYLAKGIAHNPNHVPLLALMGRCLFDSDRDQEARVYLTRAELIAPRNPILNEVRAYIASKLGD
jgi:tetratricopeptide (TPR) repeat protein